MNQIIITVLLFLAQDRNAESRRTNLTIYRQAIARVEAEFPQLKFKLNRTIEAKNKWNISLKETDSTMKSLEEFFYKQNQGEVLNIALLPVKETTSGGAANGFCTIFGAKTATLFAAAKRWRLKNPLKVSVNTLVHEILHTLGAYHDTSDSKNIMSRFAGAQGEFFTTDYFPYLTPHTVVEVNSCLRTAAMVVADN